MSVPGLNLFDTFTPSNFAFNTRDIGGGGLFGGLSSSDYGLIPTNDIATTPLAFNVNDLLPMTMPTLDVSPEATPVSTTGTSFWDSLGQTLNGIADHALVVGGQLGNLAVDAYGQQAAGSIYRGSGTVPAAAPATDAGVGSSYSTILIVGGIAVAAVAVILIARK